MPGRFERLLAGVPLVEAERIRAFLLEYLGPADRPVAFAGRKELQNQLRDWVADPKGSDAFLLVAPTGLGKSAVLCRLVAWLEAQPLEVTFFPVSIRFSTHTAQSFYSAVLSRLAFLHGERAPESTGEAQAQALMRQYLRRSLPEGRRLILVVDGLDEAADWVVGPWLWPADRPDGHRLVVSERAAFHPGVEDLASRLGIRPEHQQPETLGALTEAEVFAWMQDWPLEARANAFRLSEGEPLLLHLLLSQPEDLAKSDAIPGLKGLWARQLPPENRALHQVESWRLASALASVLGPVPRRDLLELLGWSGPQLEAALEPVRRLVLVAGEGYVFCHHRLREFFLEEELSPSERAEWQKRLLEWFRRTLEALLDGRLAPAEVSPYLTRHAAAHLRQGKASRATWVRLASEAWFRARTVGGAMGAVGFLRDIEQVERVITEEIAAGSNDAGALADLARCALIRASLIGRDRNVDGDLTSLALDAGVLSVPEVLALARVGLEAESQTFDSRSKRWLACVAPRLTDTQVPEALELAQMLDRASGGNKPSASLSLLPHLKVEHFDLFLRAVEVKDGRRFWVVADVLKTLPAELEARRPELQAMLLDELECEARPISILNQYLHIADTIGAGILTRFTPRALAALGEVELSARADYRLHLALHLAPEQRREQALEAVRQALADDVTRCASLIERYDLGDLRPEVLRLAASISMKAVVHWLFQGDDEQPRRRPSADRWHELRSCLPASDWKRFTRLAWEEAEARWRNQMKAEPLKLLAHLDGKRRLLDLLKAESHPERLKYGPRHFARWLSPSDRLGVLKDICREPGPYWIELAHQILRGLPRALLAQAEQILVNGRADLRFDGLSALAQKSGGATRKRLMLILEAETTITHEPNERLYRRRRLFGLEPTDERFEAVLALVRAGPARDLTSLTWSGIRLPEPRKSQYFGALVQGQAQSLANWRGPGLPFENDWRLAGPHATPAAKGSVPEAFREWAQRTALEAMCRSPERHIQASGMLIRSQRATPEEQPNLVRKALESARLIGDEVYRCSFAWELTKQPRFLNAWLDAEWRLDEAGRTWPMLPKLPWPEQHEAWRRELVSRAKADLLTGRPESGSLSGVLDSDDWHLLAREALAALESFSSEGWSPRVNPDHDSPDARRARLAVDAAPAMTSDQAARWLDVLAFGVYGIFSQAWQLLYKRLDPALQLAELERRLQRARGLADPDRGSLLAAMVYLRPPEERSQAVTEALSHGGWFEKWGQKQGNSGMLFNLAPHLEEDHLAEVIRLVGDGSPTQGVDLRALLFRVTDALRPRLVDRLFDHSTTVPPPWGDRILTFLVPHLAGGRLEQALAAAERAMLADAQTIPSLAEAEQLRPDQTVRVARSLLESTKRVQASPDERAVLAFGRIGARLVADSRHRAWITEETAVLLRRCAGSRGECMSALRSLMPIFEVLVGPAVREKVAEEVMTVGQWWP